MGSMSLVCPMCCGETFNSTESLKYHLLSMTDNLYCPGCSLRTYSVASLIQHLDHCGKDLMHQDESQCQSMATVSVLENDDNNASQNIIIHDENVDKAINESFLATVNEEGIMIVGEGRTIQVDENGDIQVVEKVSVKNKMNKIANDETNDNEDLLSKATSALNKDHDYDLLNSSNGNDLMEMDQDDSMTFDDDYNMNVKEEPQNALSQEEEQLLYTCNSCNVNFDNVEEHMQKFHNGQAYEVQGAKDQTNDETIEPTMESQTTETVKTPVTDTKSLQKLNPIRPTRAAKRKQLQKQALNTLKTEECVDSDGRLYTRKVVKIERFWDRTPITLSSTKAPMIEKFFSNVEGVKVKDKSVTVAPTKMYRCNQCLEQFAKISDFKVHECLQGNNQCDQCNETFPTPKALQTHAKIHETGEYLTLNQKIFTCNTCGTNFSTHKSLRLHSRMHQPVKARHVDAPEGTEEETFECDECGATLSESYRTAHMALHTGNAATCGVCNRKFDSQASLEMHAAVHVETANANAAANAAVATDLLVAANQNSIDPILSNAGISGPLVSGPSVAAAVEAAAAAEEAEASKEKPYKCQHCGRRFTRPHEKVKHERIHTGEKPHGCEVCGKKFRVSYCLTLHMRTHTGVRPYQCQHCGKRFKASSVYNHHLLTHGEERAYNCPYCPKTFKTRVQLAGHKNSHTKPFRCTECSRPFASLYAARAHIETHKKDNNLKFCCHICGASYGRAFALKDHLKNAHNQDNVEVPPEPVHEEEVQEIETYLLRNDVVEEVELIVPSPLPVTDLEEED